jgi:hypothetical protein
MDENNNNIMFSENDLIFLLSRLWNDLKLPRMV